MREIPIRQHTTYLRALLQSYGTVGLPLGSGFSFSLPQVFQLLRLRQSSVNELLQQQNERKDGERGFGEEESEEEDQAGEQKKISMTLAENGIEALGKSPQGRIVILGGPGSGKTTMLKHLLYHQAQRALEERATRLPIFLSLPDLARADLDLDAYLARIASDMGLEAGFGQFLSLAIRDGHAFVCLSGLDEVLPRQRAGIIRQINELARRNGNIWIVGSRFTDYKGGQFQQGQFQEWELQPLDNERRLKLATQLLPELQRQLMQSVDSASPHGYVQALSEHRQAATWGANPLLFSLGAVVYLRRGNLSGSRAMLYREVIDSLLETRHGDAQLRHILAHTALELYQIKGRTFTLNDLQAILTNLNVVQRATWNVGEIRQRLLNSGVFDVVASETYSFHLQTFQEYLVASALAARFMSGDEQTREDAYQLAWSKHAYSRWNEVERLLVGILVQEYGEAGLLQARAWLMRLLQQRQSEAGDPGNLSLELAVKVLGEVAELAEWQTEETLALEELVAAVWVEEVEKLTQQNTVWGGRSEDRSRDRYLVMAADIGRLRLSAQQKAVESLLKGLVETSGYGFGRILGAIHSSFVARCLLDAIERYPDQKSRKAIKQAFVYLGEFAPIDFLLSELSSQSDENTQSAMQALIQLVPYVPAEKLVPILRLSGFGRPHTAGEVLQQIAKVKKEPPVQDLLPLLHEGRKGVAIHAAYVLASIQHPAAIDFLMAHLNDSQAAERWKAVKALAHYLAHSPALLDRMIAMLEDEDDGVRREVVKAFGHLGPAMPLEALIRMANDPDTNVRLEAVEVLGTLGDRAPLDVLVQATGDSVHWVTEAAVRALGEFSQRTLLELFPDLLKKATLVQTVLEVLSKKGLLGSMPVQLLFDLCEQDIQKRDVILNILNDMRYPRAKELLIDEIVNNQYVGDRYSPQQQKKAGLFVTEQRAVLEARCVLPYNRAIAILGYRQEADVLVKALVDDRWRVSDAAAEALCALCEKGVEPALADILPLIEHKHAWVRKNALRVLAESTHVPPLEPLVAALHDRNEEVREAAAKVLSIYKENIPLDELLAATLDDSIAVRREAVNTLSKWGQRDPALVVNGVANLLRHERTIGEYEPWEGEGYREAWDALLELSAYAPAELLLQAMHDLRDIDTGCIANALGHMGERVPTEQLILMLQDQDERVRLDAATALSIAGKNAPVVALIKTLTRHDIHYNYRMSWWGVIDNLAKESWRGDVPDEIFLEKVLEKHHYATYGPLIRAFTVQKKRIPEEIVIEALEHFDHEETSIVVDYLSQFPEIIPSLPEHLVAEAFSLYNYREQHSTEPDSEGIIERLLPKLSVRSLLETITHRKREMRAGALQLLAAHPEDAPLEPILAALHDFDETVRNYALDYLQKRAENPPIQPIVASLQDSSIWVRQKAIEALASLGERAPLPELVAMLDDPAVEARFAAVEALAWPGLREQVPAQVFVNALGDGYYGSQRVIVLQALRDKDPLLVIEHAIAALGSCDNDFALAAFQILEQLQPEFVPEIVQEATSLFEGDTPGRFFRSLSLSFIADLIGDVDRATPDLITRLGELLDWPYWEVRTKAARAVGKQRRNIPDAIIRRLFDLRRDLHSRDVREAADKALEEILSLESGIEDD